MSYQILTNVLKFRNIYMIVLIGILTLMIFQFRNIYMISLLEVGVLSKYDSQKHDQE